MLHEQKMSLEFWKVFAVVELALMHLLINKPILAPNNVICCCLFWLPFEAWKKKLSQCSICNVSVTMVFHQLIRLQKPSHCQDWYTHWCRMKVGIVDYEWMTTALLMLDLGIAYDLVGSQSRGEVCMQWSSGCLVPVLTSHTCNNLYCMGHLSSAFTLNGGLRPRCMLGRI